jgi:hypothetical protein
MEHPPFPRKRFLGDTPAPPLLLRFSPILKSLALNSVRICGFARVKAGNGGVSACAAIAFLGGLEMEMGIRSIGYKYGVAAALMIGFSSRANQRILLKSQLFF